MTHALLLFLLWGTFGGVVVLSALPAPWSPYLAVVVASAICWALAATRDDR